MSETKKSLVKKIIKDLRKDRDTLHRAAAETHSSSTGEESKQEGKYDTRGLEASYLAEAQAEQLDILENQILKLTQLNLDNLTDEDPIRSGALTIFSADDDIEHGYFILPAAGGTTITYQGLDFTIITPESPIATLLIGNKVGTFLTLPRLGEGFISEIW